MMLTKRVKQIKLMKQKLNFAITNITIDKNQNINKEFSLITRLII